MAFFSKLKERLFRSSSKLEEGLEAIVADGGAASEAEPRPSDVAAPPQETAAQPERTASYGAAEGAAAGAVLPAPTDAGGAIDATAAQQAAADYAVTGQSPDSPAPVDRLAETATPADVSTSSFATPVGSQTQPTMIPEPAPSAQDDRGRDFAPDTAGSKPDAGTGSTPATWQALAPAASAPSPAPTPTPAPARPVPPTAPMASAARLSDEPRKPGLLGRLFGRESAGPVLRRELDDAMLESLEELLISSDMGVDTAMRVTANLAEGRLGKRLSVDEIKELLAQEIARIMEPVARPLPLYPKKPQVVLVVGVNGSGKTTTIGKLASQFRGAGKTVMVAAGDTFRAAAVEQLKVWGERAGVPVMTAPQGSDPASLAFDAISRAQAEGFDLLMIDTAGRLQNRQDLMEELSKIVRVIRKKDPDAPHNTLLVLDATTGQNALSQVETFRKLADVSGLVMTKLDGTAKGGVLVALADKFGLPIHAIGVGEQIEDLDAFDPQDFARALVGATTG